MSHNSFFVTKSSKAATPTTWTTGPPVSGDAQPSDVLREFAQLDLLGDLLVSHYDGDDKEDLWADGSEARLYYSWTVHG